MHKIHNSYNDTEMGHVFGPSGVDIQIILDRFGKKNNMVSGLLFFLGLVWCAQIHGGVVGLTQVVSTKYLIILKASSFDSINYSTRLIL